MTDEAAIAARRYPWTQYRGPEHQARNDWPEPERQAWHEARPWRVCWVVPDASPYNHGWRYETAVFTSEAAARAAAEASMGIAKSVTLDVSNNGWKGYAKDAKVTQLYRRVNARLVAQRKTASAAR